MKTFKTMLKTELKLSLRGMDMVIFAICVPLMVLVILGIIYGDKPAFESAGYSFLAAILRWRWLQFPSAPAVLWVACW